MNTKNPFERIILNKKKVPDNLKNKVIEDAYNTKLILDFLELFTNSVPKSIFKTVVNKPEKHRKL